MYDTILVPTAGDAGSMRAVAHAGREAQAHDADIQLLSVKDIESPLTGSPTDEDTASGWAAKAEAQATAAVERGRERLPDAIAVETFVVEGVPKGAILDHIEAYAVDLVVMATHGRTGIQRYLIGSTTEVVVRHSPVPVLTLRTTDSNADVRAA